MKIKMYEVNFGESILYESRGQKLLVDCGAKYGGKGCYAKNRVLPDIDSETKLLITHFDEDHFNGINQMPCGTVFEEIILPLYTYTKDGIMRTWDVFLDAMRVHSYLFVAGLISSELHDFFMKLPSLVGSSGRIRCVGKDDIVTAGENYRILWPYKECNIDFDPLFPNLIDIVNGSTALSEEEKGNVARAVNAYVDAFIEVYLLICERGRGEGVYGYTIEDSLRILDDRFGALVALRDDLSDAIKSVSGLTAIRNKMIHEMNECSIVFETNQKPKIIAFGDATKEVIERLKDDGIYSYDCYDVLKVQHHGTSAYWSDNIPEAYSYLISNSGSANTHWGISKEYGHHFDGRIQCTNNYPARCCYITDSKKVCANCKLIHHDQAIDITI